MYSKFKFLARLYLLCYSVLKFINWREFHFLKISRAGLRRGVKSPAEQEIQFWPRNPEVIISPLASFPGNTDINIDSQTHTHTHTPKSSKLGVVICYLKKYVRIVPWKKSFRGRTNESVRRQSFCFHQPSFLAIQSITIIKKYRGEDNGYVVFRFHGSAGK